MTEIQLSLYIDNNREYSHELIKPLENDRINISAYVFNQILIFNVYLVLFGIFERLGKRLMRCMRVSRFSLSGVLS